jgi:DNA end-binding protein Ku
MAALEASVTDLRARREGKQATAKQAAATKKKGKGDPKAATGADLDELPKAKLLELASKAGIDGRSKMTKDELAKALRKAS